MELQYQDTIINYEYHKVDDICILFLPGFRSLAENGRPLLKALDHSYITFDLPGIGDNSHIPFKKAYKKEDETLKNILDQLFELHQIDILITASLGTPFVLDYYSQNLIDSNTKLVLLSPQFEKSIPDYFLYLYCNVLIFCYYLTKKNVYRFLDNLLMAKFWMSLLNNESTNPTTSKLLEKDLQSSRSPWTEYQYISLFKYKNNVKESLIRSKEVFNNIFLFTGSKDKLLNQEYLNNLLSEVSFPKENIVSTPYNHVLETEAIDFIVSLCQDRCYE